MQETIEEEIELVSKDEVNRAGKWHNLFFIAILILTGTLSFGLGRLSKIIDSQVPIRVENANLAGKHSGAVAGAETSNSGGEALTPASETASLPAAGRYVASKSGEKYHLPWCSGAQRIKEENKIWFVTKEEAERAGYTPAANCPGI